MVIFALLIASYSFDQVLNIRRQKNEKSREYHTDLEAQAQERYQHRKQSQEEQRVKSVEVRDSQTMIGFWELCLTCDPAAKIKERLIAG